MNSGATSERVYDVLKRHVLERKFRPGERLDPALLSETMSSSVTPVRDALHRLTGERVVETRPSDGFHLPQIDAPGLEDLYAWNAEVLGLALRRWRSQTLGPVSLASDPVGAVPRVDAIATMFAYVARRSSNVEYRQAIASVNDRLHAVRIAEEHVLDGLDDELAALRERLTAGVIPEIRRGIVAYHRRRHRTAAEVVRTLYHNGVR